MRRSLRVVVIAGGVALATGCGAAGPPLVKGTITAASTVNPDIRGNARPVVVRIYELRSLAAFNTADFFALHERESETLGADLVGREQYMLRPDETKEYERQLQPDTKFIGVVAEFRDLENSRWRASAPVPATRNPTVAIGIQAREVTVALK